MYKNGIKERQLCGICAKFETLTLRSTKLDFGNGAGGATNSTAVLREHRILVKLFINSILRGVWEIETQKVAMPRCRIYGRLLRIGAALETHCSRAIQAHCGKNVVTSR